MAKASISTPHVRVGVTAKPNGHSSAQYVSPDNPPQPSANIASDIKDWPDTLVSFAQDIVNDLLAEGKEPGGLMYMVWDKSGGFKIKIMPTAMKSASAAAILRGLASNIEQAAIQSKPVGELIEESKLNG